MRRTWIRSGIYTLSCLGILCLLTVLIGGHYLSPVGGSDVAVVFNVPTGSSSRAIAKQLVAERLIRSELAFRFALRYRGAGRQLKAGSYQLRQNMSLMQILDELQKGHVALESWTVPEGLTTPAIAELWETAGFGTAAAFLAVTTSPSFLEKQGSVEGYLFPNTYKFAKGTTAETVVEMMVEEFNRRWDEAAKGLDEIEIGDKKFTRHEIIILASIIEKEAGTASERPRIASVFHNRLKRNMKLQADPTVAYALGNPERLLTRADLEVDLPYNTYEYKGLPPGPICNPGINSIRAALQPEKTDYLYFVAIGEGKHHFSKGYPEHQRMVRKMRRARRNP